MFSVSETQVLLIGMWNALLCHLITINYKMICLKGAKFLGISFIFHSDNVLSMSIVIYIYLYMYIFNTFKFMCIYIFNKSLDFEESLVSHLMFGFTYKWLEPMYF